MRKDQKINSKCLLKTGLFICATLLLLSCSTVPDKSPLSESNLSGKPYVGVVFGQSDAMNGLKILRILPGPLREALSKNLNINLEHDRLIRVDGKTVTAKTFKNIISEYLPGQVLRFEFQKSIPASPEQSIITVDITLDDASYWTGPIAKSNLISAFDNRPENLPVLTTRNPVTNYIDKEIKKAGLSEEINKLYALFYEWQNNNKGYHSLSRVMYPFQHPENLIELETTVTRALINLYEFPDKVIAEIAANLDLTTPVTDSCDSEAMQWDTLTRSINHSNELIKKAFARIPSESLVNEGLYYLLAELSQLRTPETQDNPLKSLNAMNMSIQIDFNALLNSAATFKCYLGKDLNITLETTAAVNQLPYELKNKIAGTIQKVVKQDGLWIVYGGPEDNSYDMSAIDVVYDPAGNDTYQYSKHAAASLKLVIDKAGNDKYFGNDIGPASGWFGTSILVDHQGNDHYQGTLAANGTGMMGIGLLIDYSGRDIFNGDYFSNGAAYYGAGILLDLGNEADIYQSSTFSQGFGGPRGYGLLYDHKGNDLYRANGLTPSTYGTPAVYLSLSQGIGFGLRHYDSGGIGVLYDAHGSDRYEGGEFSQGGGYYWGLGILHDDDGDDHYYGNRYSQGFAAHQATGILIDKKGNDSYWGMTAACQGAAWDIAIGLLFDAEGNDTYQGDALCQGAAAMQAMGWLVDLNGTDHYIANAPSSQGHSGSNTYHYNSQHPVFSWSLLLDAGGDEDFFSTVKENNQTIRNSDINYNDAAESLKHGLFIDHDANIF